MEKEIKKKLNSVSISGNPQVNQVLTASVEPKEAMVTYQWKQADSSGGSYTNISGATDKTYQLKSAEQNKFIKVEVVGTGEYEGTITSNATTQVQAGG